MPGHCLVSVRHTFAVLHFRYQPSHLFSSTLIMSLSAHNKQTALIMQLHPKPPPPPHVRNNRGTWPSARRPTSEHMPTLNKISAVTSRQQTASWRTPRAVCVARLAPAIPCQINSLHTTHFNIILPSTPRFQAVFSPSEFPTINLRAFR
jgi:hypothetical protein